jgi:hypothetical protein
LPRIYIGLLFISIGLAGSQNPEIPVIMNFDTAPDPAFVNRFQRDVDHIFKPANLKLIWRTNDTEPMPGNRPAIRLAFHGVCADRRVMDMEGVKLGKVKLGWTQVRNDNVLPFSNIDCDEIARLSRCDGSREAVLIDMFYRLTARVIAHELLHVLLGTTEHGNTPLRLRRLDPNTLHTESKLRAADLAALRHALEDSATMIATRSKKPPAW